MSVFPDMNKTIFQLLFLKLLLYSSPEINFSSNLINVEKKLL